MTTNNFDTQELLAFVEDTLSRRERERVRAKLASQPALLSKLERMAADRTALRSLEEPVLAEDLVATLEPVLARPMLMGQDAGQFRRIVRQRAVWPKVAIAAGFLLLAGVGAVAWWNGGLSFTSNEQPDLAVLPPANNEPTSPLVREITAHDGDLHHLEPGAAPNDTRLVNAGGNTANGAPAINLDKRILASGTAAFEADFLLELTAANDEAVRMALREAMTNASTAGTLVRTFTYDDAQRAWKELVAGSNLRDEQDALLTTLRGHRAGAAYSDQQKETIHRVVRANGSVALGERLAGRAEHAIAPDDQLRLGEAGIEFAMTLSVAEARTLLKSLLADERLTARLQLRNADDAATGGASQWSAWRNWAQAMEVFKRLDALAAAGAERLIIPIDRR